ncbi:hypothetical protein PAXRUDRAFT_164755 [Paxillus rubicundulus Ve08.2h10]|uniref:Uncharacterized protein n=1 Tax=Paxillus rubicundulus Ve08.2h10 TaxID=930991 RepID=A0A0D0D3M2_9AGAM|nr:hypothetical protein PAXRUDRAFT_164755 [Paxillus rubicundulus Ve08.2h10]
MVSWCSNLLHPSELDEQLHCLPPAFGVCHFKNGISAMSQISGKEQKYMARVLLAYLVGKVQKSVVLAYRTLLDFIYIAQYPPHDDVTLGYLQDSLDLYQKHKNVLFHLRIQDHLDIPKFHSMVHYIDAIKQFGTTDNYNSEAFERLHIDLAKEGWRGSNKRYARPQMVAWLERVEKIGDFASYLEMRRDEEDLEMEVEQRGGQNLLPKIRLAKRVHHQGQTLTDIVDKHACPGFINHMKTYLNLKLTQSWTRGELQGIEIPFQTLDIYHSFKFALEELGVDSEEDQSKAGQDSVKARPSVGKQPACFDTVIVMNTSECESTGVKGDLFSLLF